MTDTKLLLKVLENKGMTQAKLAKAIGISRQSMCYKVNNKREFKPSEMNKILEALGITDYELKERIFFAA